MVLSIPPLQQLLFPSSLLHLSSHSCWTSTAKPFSHVSAAKLMTKWWPPPSSLSYVGVLPPEQWGNNKKLATTSYSLRLQHEQEGDCLDFRFHLFMATLSFTSYSGRCIFTVCPACTYLHSFEWESDFQRWRFNFSVAQTWRECADTHRCLGYNCFVLATEEGNRWLVPWESRTWVWQIQFRKQNWSWWQRAPKGVGKDTHFVKEITNCLTPLDEVKDCPDCSIDSLPSDCSGSPATCFTYGHFIEP